MKASSSPKRRLDCLEVILRLAHWLRKLLDETAGCSIPRQQASADIRSQCFTGLLLSLLVGQPYAGPLADAREQQDR